MILVMGATGNVGSAVVAALLDWQVPVRAVSRHTRSWPSGVEGIVADPNRPDGLREAARGVEGVFLLAGYAAEADLLGFLDDVHVTLLSASSAPLGDEGNGVASPHLDSERALQASGLPWTIVRPCSLQSNMLRWREDLRTSDTIHAPFTDVPVAAIDPADVGAVVATTLVDSSHLGRIHRLSGPEALTPPEQVRRLGIALDRTLSCTTVEDDEVAGTPFGDATIDIFRRHPEFESTVLTAAVSDLLGRAPTPVDGWISRRSGDF